MESVKFAEWLLIYTDDCGPTQGICRRYKNTVYNIEELYNIYKERKQTKKN